MIKTVSSIFAKGETVFYFYTFVEYLMDIPKFNVRFQFFAYRDDFLIENSSMIVAYYDGRNRGGTFYTMNQAERHKVPVVNLY